MAELAKPKEENMHKQSPKPVAPTVAPTVSPAWVEACKGQQRLHGAAIGIWCILSKLEREECSRLMKIIGAWFGLQ